MSYARRHSTNVCPGNRVRYTVLIDLKSDTLRVARAASLPELLGVEGAAAARYFRSFGAMLQAAATDAECAFDFKTRNRRPPTDPATRSSPSPTRSWSGPGR